MNKTQIELFDFEKLKVYQKTLDFVDHVYKIVENFPEQEKYDLTRQFKRAAYSIALNIGEGSAGSRKEFINFLTISIRSLRECIVCATIARRQKYIDESIEIEVRKKLTEISKMLSGLLAYLESGTAKNSLSEPTEDYLRTTNYELPTSDFELPTQNG
jgi:four helix bundle protein